MPKSLRDITVSKLEASCECFALGLVGLALPQRHTPRTKTAGLVPATGLLGAAAELALAACLVELGGERVLEYGEAGSGRFKSATAILDDFRKLLGKKPAFLFAGILEASAHLDDLRQAAAKLQLIFHFRAAALHAGVGLSREACVAVANDVHLLLSTMRRSTRIAPYLRSLPVMPAASAPTTLMLDELVRRLPREGLAPADLLSAIYLVLPEAPLDAPDWLTALQRACVVPRRKDIRLLLRSVEDARPVQLQRAAGKGPGLSVTIRKDDPSAIPVAPSMISREFTGVVQKWNADIATANGRLRDGVLHLPPVDFIYDLFAAGPAALRAQLDRDTFTAHEIWPFVAAAIATQGTPGPHWFLVRMTEDFGQLESLLKSAALARSSSHLRRHLPSTIEGISHLRLARQIPTWIQPVLDRRSKGEKARSKLLERVEKQSGTLLDPGMFKGLLESAAGPGRKVGDSLTALANGGLTGSEDARRYWIRLLAETAQTLEDVPGLTLVMHDGTLASAHTEARKALEFIDLAVFGPTVSTTTVSAATFSSVPSGASHGGRALGLASTTPMPSIGHEPRVLESVDIPRLLWALEWSNRSGRGPQRAADLARIVSEHAGIKFEPPNAARAFRRFKAHDTASTFWHENPKDSYTITPAGRAALSTATSTVVPIEKPKIR